MKQFDHYCSPRHSPFYWPTRHKVYLKQALKELNNDFWSWKLPVFLLNRSWLRLKKIHLHELSSYLIIDNSSEAPELRKYFHLQENGHDSLLALQECWNEFGMEEFYRALRAYWDWQSRGNNGWTFNQYISLINQYKAKISKKERVLPLIILGAPNTKDKHILKWISRNSLSGAIL